jgi:D-alanyl-D-alanine carboxypeptidase
VSGIKIGNTDEAKNTTEVVSQREGKKLLVILLGADGVLKRDLYAAQLLDLGFKQKGLEAMNVNESQLRTKYATWKY